MAQRKQIGQQGETLVAAYLAEQGYNIIQRNWRCPLGELDIVAETGGTLIFVEVRTRRSHRFGLAEESITPTKQSRLVDLAQIAPGGSMSLPSNGKRAGRRLTMLKMP
jgi:putative endonuclease